MGKPSIGFTDSVILGGSMMDYFTRIETIDSALCELTGEQVYILFTQYHGLQLLDDGFRKHLIDEGYMEDETLILKEAFKQDTVGLVTDKVHRIEWI
jgi:hypothetical protein